MFAQVNRLWTSASSYTGDPGHLGTSQTSPTAEYASHAAPISTTAVTSGATTAT